MTRVNKPFLSENTSTLLEREKEGGGGVGDFGTNHTTV